MFEWVSIKDPYAIEGWQPLGRLYADVFFPVGRDFLFYLFIFLRGLSGRVYRTRRNGSPFLVKFYTNTDNYFLNLVDRNQIWIVITLHWLVWYQTELHLVLFDEISTKNCLDIFKHIKNMFLCHSTICSLLPFKMFLILCFFFQNVSNSSFFLSKYFKFFVFSFKMFRILRFFFQNVWNYSFFLSKCLKFLIFSYKKGLKFFVFSFKRFQILLFFFQNVSNSSFFPSNISNFSFFLSKCSKIFFYSFRMFQFFFLNVPNSSFFPF